MKQKNHHEQMITDFKRRFWVCLTLTIPILLLSPTVQSLFGISVPIKGDLFLLLGFSTVVYVYGGWPFIKGFCKELKSLRPGMMTLIALAITVAYFYSFFVVLGLSKKMFFWELATLIDVMLLGHWIEMRSVMGASRALEKLAALMPNIAHLVLPDGEIKDVPLSEVGIGDKLLIRPGEKIAADGVIIDGESEVNEAALTGESKPVSKKSGDKVIGGAINGGVPLTIEVQKTGKDSYIALVVVLVKKAMQSKSRAQDLANIAAAWLTLVALLAGSVTFMAWWIYGQMMAFGLERAVTVMVITCPHALGLAIPLVVTMITGLAAARGLVIRDRVAFEEAYKLDVIIFDKTGTLTTGKFGVTDIVTLGTWSEADLLSKTASLELYSKHSIASAIVEHAKEKRVTLSNVEGNETIAGKGAKGIINGQELFVGNMRMLEDIGVSFDREEGVAKKISGEGKTIVYVATKEKVEGVIGLADIIREESLSACTNLKKLGFSVAMITGDNKDTADAVAKQLGIDVVLAEVLPDKKAEEVKKLQEKGKMVAMVGDGINDAPALAQANVGIAIGAGTDIAIETADVVLVKNDPRNVVDIVELSKLTRRKMIQNLAWATGYNVVAIPLAAGVLYNQGIVLSPAVGALIMSISTIVVAINSRLIRLKPA